VTSADTRKRLRIRVDPIRCTAFGFCAEFCPELFTLDEWGYAWLKQRDVDGAAEQLVRETARLCPRNAIAIDEVDDDAERESGFDWTTPRRSTRVREA
jgi:ferredoxin